MKRKKQKQSIATEKLKNLETQDKKLQTFITTHNNAQVPQTNSTSVKNNILTGQVIATDGALQNEKGLEAVDYISESVPTKKDAEIIKEVVKQETHPLKTQNVGFSSAHVEQNSEHHKINSKHLNSQKNAPVDGTVKKKDKTNRLLMSITSICLVATLLVVGRFFMLQSGVGTGQQFRQNTTINGINVGGMDNYKVQQVLSSEFNKKAEDFKLTLTYNGKRWTFDKNDFVVNSNIHTIIEEAQIREQINQSHESQLNAINSIAQSGESINVAFNYIFVGLDEKIDKIIEEINVPYIDSKLTFNPKLKDNFEITKEVHGIKVNKEQLYYDINEQFLKSNVISVEIPTLIDEARVTNEDNLRLTHKISEFSTSVSDSTGNRKSNVKLALQRVNGLVVEPKQQISFNEITGPHTLNNGYKVATIIFNGQFTDGVGGGICQASTTLYNALLLADVQVDQVSKHTLPVRYVPLALDAMVAEGVADLKFTNNYDTPIFIKTSSTPNDVKVEIFGAELSHGMQLKTRSEVIKKIPHKGDVIKQDVSGQYQDKVLYIGEQHRITYPRDGFEAVAYVDYYKDGQLVLSKKVRHETYYPQQGLIVEGVVEKPAGFNDTTTEIEPIKPNREDVNTFLFNMQNQEEFVDSVPTNYCP